MTTSTRAVRWRRGPLRPGGWGWLGVPFAAASLVMLLIAGCTTGSHARPHGHSQNGRSQSGQPGGTAVVGHGINWHGCGRADPRLRCGSVKVPLDYAKPAGRMITLALAEIPATAPVGQRQGVLLVNPGGPGGSMWLAGGPNLASYVAQGLSPAVAARYDIVGFDTRGVGHSVPAMHCDPGFFARTRPDYIPANAAAERVLIGRARAYAGDCERKYGWLLPYMTTANIARDMDQIRAALGQSKLNYFGYSYGTYLGQVYATLFPHRVRRMVLDSTVDPTGVWWADNIAQDYAFQARLNAFFAWAARYDSTYHLGATPSQVSKSWYRARAMLEAHPARNPSGAGVGADEFDDTYLYGGYENSVWPQEAVALASYLHHSAAGLLVTSFNEFGVQNENEFAVYNAVECADVAWPRNWARWNTDTRRVYGTAPFEAWDNAWFNAACAFWPVHGPARPMRIGAAGLPGILMLQGTLDAATPYQGAQNAHRRLPTARMVVVSGGGNHGQFSPYSPNRCVNGYVDRYLATGALPSGPGLVNATCATLPDPSPTG